MAEKVGAPLAAPPAVTGGDADQAPAGAHAGPSVRRMARELGVDLSAVTASGPKGRITKDDLLGFLKGPAQPAAAAAAPAAPQGSGIPEIPAQDFTQVRSGRDPAAAADQEGVGAVPAPLLAQRPARHAQRRGGHHRAGRLPQAPRHRRQGRQEPLPGHAAGVPGQGRGRRAQAAPGVQQLADRRRRTRSSSRATTTSASPSTPPAGWSCPWSRTPTARASSS